MGMLEELEARVSKLEREREEFGFFAGFVDQKNSPLGRRRHCAAVRRRLESGAEGAAISGRKMLLSKEALREELRAGVSPAISSAENDEFYRDLMRRSRGE